MEAYNTFSALNAVAAANKNFEKNNGAQKRVYYCQRCLNHGQLEPRKNHKCDCAFANCTCAKCILVERRRVLNTQLHELEEISESAAMQDDIKTELDDGDVISDSQPTTIQSSSVGRVKGGKLLKPKLLKITSTDVV
uniref:DM domain-containing protein n=1 Tax=Rhabditophanes sp. KR3021 TaxID=114890 RepID=A0AC35UG70_9BILA